jgi:hypothetical protein
MSTNARRVISVVWLPIPPLLLSALIHAIDPRVGGAAGLFAPAVLLSVAVWSLPVLALVLLCLLAAFRWGWSRFIELSIVAAAAVSATLVIMQSPRVTGSMPNALPLLSGTLIAWLFLAGAVAPALALGWPHKLPRSGARKPTERDER